MRAFQIRRNNMGKALLTLLVSAFGCGAALAQGADAPKPPIAKIVSPTYKQAWKIEAPDWASRMAVGDVTGDKTPRLLLSDSKNRLTVYKIETSELKSEAEIELGAKGERFAVGRFYKGKPEAIVVAGAVYLQEAGKYVRSPSPDILSVNGLARYADGTDEVLQWEPNAPPQTWAFETERAGVVKTGRGIRPPNIAAGFLKLVVIRGSAEFLEPLGGDGDYGKAGVIGSFDARGDGGYYLWSPQVTANGSYFTVSSVEGKLVWKSEKLDGKILDVAHGNDPKGGKKRGVFLLLAEGADSKKRSVIFLALEEARGAAN